MDMEGLGTEEQLMGLSNNDATYIVKGKRTKRLRLLSPCGVAAAITTAMTSSCSSDGSFSSTATTADQEEEDMANCLILLAQGGSQSHHHQKQQQPEHDHGEKGSTSSNRRFTEMATPNAMNTNTKVGFYIYECKTCNRTFPSFQALGGHRASHKKSKLMAEEKKPPSPSPPPPLLPPPSSSPSSQTKMFDDEFEEAGKPPLMKIGPPISLQLGSQNQNHRAFHGNKAKIHECSICGSEFTSGQALGGHMRRHRASSSSTNNTTESSFKATTTATAIAAAQPRNILQLDLNLPAPEDDLRESKFQFPATQKSMVLSAAPALVDCHY